MTQHSAIALVDGANFANSCRDLHIGDINYTRFLGALRKLTATTIPLLCKHTIHPLLHKKYRGLSSDLKKAGVEAVPVISCTGADDALLKKWICECVKIPHIQRLIVVTCDKDIIHQAVQSTHFANHNGKTMETFIVATTTCDDEGRCRICQSVLEEINSTAHVNFLELMSFIRPCSYAGPRH